MATERKKNKRADKRIKSLRAKSLSPKQTKSVKGGQEKQVVSTYNFFPAWPRK